MRPRLFYIDQLFISYRYLKTAKSAKLVSLGDVTPPYVIVSKGQYFEGLASFPPPLYPCAPCRCRRTKFFYTLRTLNDLPGRS